ncbi:MAG: 16S rRNA (adenine(1518)-N(6)/adenine(1519)-N(6))-dimethyltransferase RsmA [Bacteroidales bacterium]|nr:16S rRNA (adenine(1518)-N(6)/adenine(1519)-N(6))-dimethyltransferase RsmA [Bacteroidales bacterium]
MYEVRAKKQLGQHFLKDENIASAIADSLSPTVQSLLEVGPGTGMLTKYLLKKGFQDFKVIELDRESVSYLESHYPELGSGLISGDFLRLDIKKLFPGTFALIGNFPYNISSQIFFKAIDERDRVSEIVGMLQQEVAQRIAAGPGSKTYGILSVLLQAWYKVEYLFTVPPTVFVPPPKVTSAVVRLIRNEVIDLGCNPKLFHTVVKTAFNQRRKTLHNALKPLADYQGPYSSKRAEQLSVYQFVELTLEIEALKPAQSL